MHAKRLAQPGISGAAPGLTGRTSVLSAPIGAGAAKSSTRHS